jgi:hypothetical protein
LLGKSVLTSSTDLFEESRYLPVDDVVCVAIVDTLQDLLHQNGGIFFCELSPSDDFIE